MTVFYAVTFEFDSRQPLTHRGTVSASTGSTCFARAVRTAQKALRPVGWSSVVCVLLQRVQDAKVQADLSDAGYQGLVKATKTDE